MEIASLFIWEFISDVSFMLKVFVMMTLANWVRNHLGDSPVSWILIVGIGYFVLFDGWAVFGPIYLLYLLLGFGVSSIIIDFFFVGAGGPPEQEGIESPVSSGVDIMKRMGEKAAHMNVMRRR
ncbi:MAG TPA: hypothetical protein HA254_07165 [Candidatus Diapherotrites archaeon]|uniref:Uncharacterized protein n=1 Tax=Candidatus Iainarchaeum sp. TaxID=3101447 RepID=A0A7J4J1Y1_9ARCH|nr:hypothetical protein [Candidatus Diapherotrites archaeon]